MDQKVHGPQVHIRFSAIVLILTGFRFTAFFVCLSVHDVLASLYANQLYVSCAPQI